MVDEVRTARALLGFMTKQDGLNFLRDNCVFFGRTESQLVGLWEKCAQAVARLSDFDDSAEVLDFGQELDRKLKNISRNSRVIEATKEKVWSFKRVEIDKLVCFQKYVDVDYANTISKDLDFSKEDVLVDFCLSDKYLGRASRGFRIGPHGYAISADGHDLRTLDLDVLEDKEEGATSLNLKVGWGVPAAQVVQIGNRYLLKNGYHRAYALKSREIKHLPCILIQGKQYSDVDNPGPPGFFDEPITTSKKPPAFSCFFSADISLTVKVRALRKFIVLAPDSYTMNYPEAESHLVALSKEIPASTTISKYHAEEVKIGREDWNVYRLDDETILKIRTLVHSAVLKRGSGKDGFSLTAFNTEPVLAVLPLENRIGPPSHGQITMDLIDKRITRDVAFRRIREPTNEYVTNDGHRFTFRLKLLSVSGTDLFDKDGLPIYRVKTAGQIDLVK